MVYNNGKKDSFSDLFIKYSWHW